MVVPYCCCQARNDSGYGTLWDLAIIGASNHRDTSGENVVTTIIVLTVTGTRPSRIGDEETTKGLGIGL